VPAETQRQCLSGLVTLIFKEPEEGIVHPPVILLTALSQLETQRGLGSVSWSTLRLVGRE